MKKTLLVVLACLCSLSLHAQITTFNYHGVARSHDGAPLRLAHIAVRLSILDAAGSSKSLYSEAKSVQTNDFGLYQIAINDGTGDRSGSIAGIDWSTPKFLKTEIDINNGSTYTDMGTTLIQHVPLALTAKNLEGVTNPMDGDLIEFKNGKWSRKPASKYYQVAGLGTYQLGQTLGFVSSTATVTFEHDNPIITIHLTKLFGTTLAAGAGGLVLNLGHRKQGEFPYDFENSDRLVGIRVHGNTRMPVTLSGTYKTNFHAGDTYELGMIGASSESEDWNNNAKTFGYIEVSY